MHHNFKFVYVYIPMSNAAAYKMAKNFVDSEIKNPVVVFSTTYCPFCKMAKDVLGETDVNYTLHELDERGVCLRVSPVCMVGLMYGEVGCTRSDITLPMQYTL